MQHGNGSVGRGTPALRFGGFTVRELLAILWVVLIIVSLLALAVNPRRRYAKASCTNNLKKIDIAFRIWALDNSGLLPMQVSTNQGGTKELVGATNVFVHFLVMSNELITPKYLICPMDTARIESTSFQTNFDNSKVDYFLGVDAVNTNRSTLLCGDRNLTVDRKATPGFLLVSKNTPVHWTSALHNGIGCLLFADGSVQRVYNAELPGALHLLSGTNRLLFP